MPRPIDLLTETRPDSLTDARAILARAKRGEIDYTRSPTDWRDQVLYFLLPDRFSDGKEDTRPLLTRNEIRNLRQTTDRPDWNWQKWAESGKRWQGGTLQGIRSKLSYLRDLGITTLWVGPVFTQRVRVDSYHGYGIQDFLDVDRRFGSRKDLVELVQAAHEQGIYIVLDVIVNHSGDNWGYVEPRRPLTGIRRDLPPFRPWPDFYGNTNNPETRDWRLSWRNERQDGFTDDPSVIQGRQDAVWPREFQDRRFYTRAGMGDLGRGDIGDPHAENKRTDFFALKDFALDVGDTLASLVEIFQYWVAITDCDGFRIDTVKHMALEETRNFCGAIREFCDMLGKPNFLLAGEIAGGDFFQDFVLDRLALLTRNLTSALDIGNARIELSAAGKGLRPGSGYLDGFKENSEDFGSHRSVGQRHVSILDDHDHVFGDKVRFSADIPDDSPVKDHQVSVPTALQLYTLGIPCIYYGTEQAFAGPAHSQRRFVLSEGWNDGGNYGDRYLREAMFGPLHPRTHFDNDLTAQVDTVDTEQPGFGPFGSAGKHCFDRESPAYRRIAHLCKVRSENQVLRVGRQYARQVRLPHTGFEFAAAGEIVAWSRILGNVEALCIVNPNGIAQRGGDVIVAAELWPVDTEFTVIANSAEAAGVPAVSHPLGSRLRVRGLALGLPAFLEIRNLQPAEVLVLLAR